MPLRSPSSDPAMKFLYLDMKVLKSGKDTTQVVLNSKRVCREAITEQRPLCSCTVSWPLNPRHSEPAESNRSASPREELSDGHAPLARVHIRIHPIGPESGTPGKHGQQRGPPTLVTHGALASSDWGQTKQYYCIRCKVI